MDESQSQSDRIHINRVHYRIVLRDFRDIQYLNPQDEREKYKEEERKERKFDVYGQFEQINCKTNYLNSFEFSARLVLIQSFRTMECKIQPNERTELNKKFNASLKSFYKKLCISYFLYICCVISDKNLKRVLINHITR